MMGITLTPRWSRNFILTSMSPRDIVPDDIDSLHYKRGHFMKAEKGRAEPDLPLTPAMFQVLLSLADGEKHGYAILKDVEAQTHGSVLLGTGTLYGIIKRLLGEGMIVECRRRPARGDDDARRRYYELTARGRQVAVAEAERMAQVLAIARGKRLLKRLMPV